MLIKQETILKLMIFDILLFSEKYKI